MKLVLWLFLGFSSAHAADRLSFEQYLADVKANNPSFTAARLRAEALEERVGPAGAWSDPFFAMGIDQIPTKGQDTTSVWRYQVSQALPFPGKLGSKKEAARLRAEGAEGERESAERGLTLLAIQVYYRAYFNELAQALNSRLRRIVSDAEASSKARYKTGGSSHHEWLLAKAELSILEVEKLRHSRERKLLVARLNELRNLPPETAVGALEFKENGRAVEPSLRGQPELKSFQAAVTALSAEERFAKLSYLPDFVIQGMYMKPRGMPMEGAAMATPNWGFMVGINVPLFFFQKQSNLVVAASLDREALEQEQRGLENRLRTEEIDGREQLATAKSIVELYRDSVIPTTKIAVGNARAAYTARRLPLSQYLDLLKTERTQELEFLASRIDVELAKARLENLLSAPPLMRFAPLRPTLFGGMGGAGGVMNEMPEATSMGKGVVNPAKPKASPDGAGSGSGMEGM